MKNVRILSFNLSSFRFFLDFLKIKSQEGAFPWLGGLRWFQGGQDGLVKDIFQPFLQLESKKIIVNKRHNKIHSETSQLG